MPTDSHVLAAEGIERSRHPRPGGSGSRGEEGFFSFLSFNGQLFSSPTWITGEISAFKIALEVVLRSTPRI